MSNSHYLPDQSIQGLLDRILKRRLSPFDMLPHGELREKLVELVLYGEPPGIDKETAASFQSLRYRLAGAPVEQVKVVVFGGGTGLSNIIGGDSRSVSWTRAPFVGLKEFFPQTRSVVCVTDDGGSTGELLKDIPLIALGDIRHVLLSSIQSHRLQNLYGLSAVEALEVVRGLAALFNYRFSSHPGSVLALFDQCGVRLSCLPDPLAKLLERLLDFIFSDIRLSVCLERKHCLGNLILAASIYEELPVELSSADLVAEPSPLEAALQKGLAKLYEPLGICDNGVLPSTATQAQLSFLYANGVQVTGEHKSGFARRGVPVEQVFSRFCGEPRVLPEVIDLIAEADIIVMAPGSLYSSLIPILQVPGIADAVRSNAHALKILVSNLWAQGGETDLSISDPERRFYVSDTLKAYEKNIPGGTVGLFDQVICLSLKDVPGSILQEYALEGKIPIYLDREQVSRQGFVPLECGIFSQEALAEKGVIQHDPEQLARVVKTLWVICRELHPVQKNLFERPVSSDSSLIPSFCEPSISRYQAIDQQLDQLEIEVRIRGASPLSVDKVRDELTEILWSHKDIPLDHLDNVTGLCCIDGDSWKRDQRWDRVYSFYDPSDGLIKIRADQFSNQKRFEVAFLVALGQALLGNYSAEKKVLALGPGQDHLGKVYHLRLRDEQERKCFFDNERLREYLQLSRMVADPDDSSHFTRLVNGEEGFTPPGLLMGLIYAWYLDNNLASHIEYKMAVMKVAHSDLIPEQVNVLDRRKRLVNFFREVVFRL